MYVSITVRFFTKALSAALITSWLVCSSLPPTREREQPQSNWTSADAPCAKFENLRKPLLRDIGVKIEEAEPWTDAFRRALRFWNTVLETNFHEETDLSACSVRIIDDSPDILGHAVAARSQVTSLANFSGKIAVSQKAAKEMDRSEIYAAAVHEIGHLLGLKHKTNIHSVMYFLDVDGTGVLDGKDIFGAEQAPRATAADFRKRFCPDPDKFN